MLKMTFLRWQSMGFFNLEVTYEEHNECCQLYQTHLKKLPSVRWDAFGVRCNADYKLNIGGFWKNLIPKHYTDDLSGMKIPFCTWTVFNLD